MSYALDTGEHKTQTRQIYDLRWLHGIDAQLDSYADDDRRDWYAWYLDVVAQ